MKVLYTLFNEKFDFPEDIQVFFEHDNAILMRDFLNKPWRDEDGIEHQPESDGTYEIGAESFRDEEWPTVLRVLGIMRHTEKDEVANIEIIKNVVAVKERRNEE